MGQYDRHVFVCTSGETCPTQGDTEKFVKILRDGARKAGAPIQIRVNKAGCFSQCGHGPMIVVYPENVWYAGVQESDLDEILTSHILGGRPVERLCYDPGVPGANKKDVAPKDAEKKPAPAPAEVKPAPAASAEAKPALAPAAAGPHPGPGWKHVCRVDEVSAGGLKQFTVDGTDLVIAEAGGELYAYQAMCPHEAIPLEQGIHDGCVLTCLEHMWQFDLKTGAPMGDALEGLTAYPLKREGNDVYVEVRGTAEAGRI